MSKKNPNALMDLIIYRIRAIENGFWLEALTLAHLFVESQLRLILLGKSDTKGNKITNAKISKQKYVMNLANLARDNHIIDIKTWRLIKDFNTARNNAIHHYSNGEITYDELESPAKNSGELISILQQFYASVWIGPEMKND